MTDGKANRFVDQTASRAEELKTARPGVHLMMIGVSEDINEKQLLKLASSYPDGNPMYYHADTTGLLKIVAAEIEKNLCEIKEPDPVLEPKPEKIEKPITQCVEPVRIVERSVVEKQYELEQKCPGKGHCKKLVTSKAYTDFTITDGALPGVDVDALRVGTQIEIADFQNMLPVCSNRAPDANLYAKILNVKGE